MLILLVLNNLERILGEVSYTLFACIAIYMMFEALSISSSGFMPDLSRRINKKMNSLMYKLLLKVTKTIAKWTTSGFKKIYLKLVDFFETRGLSSFKAKSLAIMIVLIII